MQNRGLAHTLYPETSLFCSRLDNSVRICRKICRFTGHATNMKPVITGYDRSKYCGRKDNKNYSDIR
ncbi:hypothetical protein D3C81_65400 [compost metagenome]